MMKKKLLKLQLQEANKRITELRQDAESNDWKLKLWEKLSSPDLHLVSFNIENDIRTIETGGSNTPHMYNTGHSTITLTIYQKPKKSNG